MLATAAKKLMAVIKTTCGKLLKFFTDHVNFHPSQCHMYSAGVKHPLPTTFERSITMQTSSALLLTAAKLAELVALGHNRISQIYLHWTAGRYGQLYDDYHFNIDADGSVYQTCTQLTELKSHTWHRNTGAIGIALCCACGALPHNGRDTEFGKFPPTPRQIDAAGKLVAKLAQGLNIPIDRWNVLTHCEAALIDGYGPYSGDAETRWDLWYLRDSPGDGAMKPGGQVIRGKALWYAKSSPLV